MSSRRSPASFIPASDAGAGRTFQDGSVRNAKRFGEWFGVAKTCFARLAVENGFREAGGPSLGRSSSLAGIDTASSFLRASHFDRREGSIRCVVLRPARQRFVCLGAMFDTDDVGIVRGYGLVIFSLGRKMLASEAPQARSGEPYFWIGCFDRQVRE